MKPVIRRLLAASAVFGAVLVVALGLGAASATAGSEQTRPFSLTLQSEFFVEGDFCDSGAPLQIITGSGIATHMGRFDIQGEYCLGAPTGNVTWIAANGDEINIVFVGVITVEPDGSATITFGTLSVDGTGRFENVVFDTTPLSGPVWLYDEFGLNGRLEASMEGTITYDASNRSN